MDKSILHGQIAGLPFSQDFFAPSKPLPNRDTTISRSSRRGCKCSAMQCEVQVLLLLLSEQRRDGTTDQGFAIDHLVRVRQ